MKKLVLTIFSVMIFFTSCKNVSDINVNPKAPTEVDPEMIITSVQINLANLINTPSYSSNVSPLWANYWTQTTYTEESNYDTSNRDVGGNIFFSIYTSILHELNLTKKGIEAITVSATLEPVKKNKLAVVKILRAYSFQYLVDNFGNVPFSDALNADNTVPAYDDDQAIYDNIVTLLREAIADIDDTKDGFKDADLIYHNNMGNWKKFAASILLDMGLKMQDGGLVSFANTTGVFTSNSDSAAFQYLSSPPYVNPIYNYFVLNSRDSDFVVTQNFIDLMNSFGDTERMSKYFANNVVPYEGGIVGATNTYAILTHPNASIIEPDRPGLLLDYINVEFQLAEAIEKNYITGNAVDHYNAGITASFEKWGLTSVEANAYLANPNVAYATATGTYQEKIGVQKYIALYPNGHVAWTEARRLDFPVLATAANSGLANPKRMIYPIDEHSVNEANYDAASAAMGGDTTTSPIFWDN